jgi:hypothetical protein
VTSVLPPRTSEHEQQQLAALHEYQLLDAPADDAQRVTLTGRITCTRILLGPGGGTSCTVTLPTDTSS